MKDGVTMKLMDEVAGIVAARHCKTNIVTASVDAINFHRKIKKGCVITVSGRMTFTSNKSIEIEVFVDADPLVEAEKGKYRAVTAFFTYISLDKENKPLLVPPLKLEGEEEQKRFEEGKARYLQNKAKRLADKECQQ
ncbi:cytosolic acyl coenzyme A thioester hydrolase-like [Sinocyclocheilus rhinocerous]|uniref:cytosolic acyl coenzyme A thioester hydrolase-like n=1 Tax=Sinocyclocheilus rhinocerous TaxID=307959 RepID=UPI0007B8C31C|nr:PREDICTED: cytosolic acyl coenzyme A thioester hydrolase-like [Sinocyclocheilus rhinocerous]